MLLDTIRGTGEVVDALAEFLPAALVPELVAAYARPGGDAIARQAVAADRAAMRRTRASKRVFVE